MTFAERPEQWMLLQAYHDWAADSVLDVRIQLEQCLQNTSVPAKSASRGKSPLAGAVKCRLCKDSCSCLRADVRLHTDEEGSWLSLQQNMGHICFSDDRLKASEHMNSCFMECDCLSRFRAGTQDLFGVGVCPREHSS